MENKYASLKKSVVILLGIALLLIVAIPESTFRNPSIVGKVLSTARIVSGFAPTFDFNLTNYTVLQTGTFTLDINCSDIEIFDVIYYYDNFSGFDINISTGLINQTGFNNSVVGNNTINITCSDGTLNTSQVFNLNIVNINEPPVLESIGNQIAITDEQFTLQLIASDPDGDNLTYNASTSLFTVSATGYIDFTPTVAQVGEYTINISVFDGQLHDWEIIVFRIVRAPFCGDGLCGSGERCGNCAEDCGSCPSPEIPPQPGGTGGTTGVPGIFQGEVGSSPAPYYRCDEKWECTEWEVCSLEGATSRKCKDINKCNTRLKKPIEGRECEYVPTCEDRIMNGDEDGIDCGGPCESCIVANCFDSIQNQNETGIDCGGQCRPCEERKFAQVPFIELPAVFKMPRQFPWILAIMMAIVVVSTITSDQVYMKKIRKRKFNEFREALINYRPLRSKLYKFAVNVPVVTLIISLHIYFFSTDFERMVAFAWIPITLIITIPLGVTYLNRFFTYNEYKKRRKDQILKQTHKRELIQLIGVENKVLAEMESKVKGQIYSMSQSRAFEEYPELYSQINPVYSVISEMEKARRERVDGSKISTAVFQKMLDLSEDPALNSVSKDYPEFMSIKEIMNEIKESINFDTTDREQEFMYDMKQVSLPQMMLLVKSRPDLTRLYNELVDVYNHFVDKETMLDKKDEDIVKIERSFADKFKEIGKKAQLLDIIAKNTDLANLYNGLMDLFNHYMRKAELGNKVKGL
jgi:hypothetical protein